MTSDEDRSAGIRSARGARHAKGVWGRLYRPRLTNKDVHWLVTHCSPNRSRASFLFRKWDEYQENGGDLESFRREVLLEWRDHLDAIPDPLFTSAARSTVLEDMFESYRAVNEAVWTCWIRPGRMGYVTGEMESGKTDFMERVAQLYIAGGGQVVSCIPLTREIENHIYCTRLTEYIRTGCQFALHGIPFLNLLDETFFYASGETPLDPKVRAYRAILRVSRKLGIATLLASQKESDILRDVREWSKFHVEKMDPDRPDQASVDLVGELEGKPLHFKEYVREIPPTDLPFRSEAIGSFVVDMDPMELLHVLSKAEMTSNQYQVTLDWLDERGYQFSREEKQYLARKMREIGKRKITLRNIADILSVSESTVTRYLSEPT